MTTTQAVAKPTQAARVPALDFTKGALVLIMVLYHWINYFIGPDWPYYRYLRFLTPSFIFISGFLISNVYFSKYNAADVRLRMRLFTRGLKLLALFILLNLARSLLLPRLSTGSVTASQFDLVNVVAVYVVGNTLVPTGKVVAFYILVPISYLLVLSAGLLAPYRLYKYTFHVVCVVMLLCILILSSNGIKSPNLEFVTVGLVGVLLGFLPIERVNHLVRHPLMLAVAYLLYLMAISIWNVPFGLLIVGACLSVMVIYMVGLGYDEPSRTRRHIILLGQYSLFGYVGQIAILQFLSVSLRHVNLGYAILAISFLAAFGLTMVSVEIVDRAKAKSAIVNRLYRAAFA